LLKEGNHDGVIDSSDPSANLSVSSDPTAITSSITQFVNAYNAVNQIANDQFSLNPSTNSQGPLAGDAALRNVISSLRSQLSAPSNGTDSNIRTLSDIGITFQTDGSLAVDNSKLTGTLQTDLTGVSDLFSLVQNGLGKRVPDLIDSFINSVSGSLTARQQGIQNEINLIDQQVASEQDRITAYQDQLTQQFAALEQTVSQLQSQSNFLLQNFASTLLNSNSQSLSSSTPTPSSSSLNSSTQSTQNTSTS